ncbi:MAG: DUF3488 domain-containing protein [Phycisphaerales bacterium]|nr:DUF3488 domain-containing protein [Phycisphaerales bacterium]
MNPRPTKSRSIESDYRFSLFWSILGTLTLFAVADANPVFGVLSLAGALAAWNISVKNNTPISRSAINVTLVLVLGLALIVTIGSGIGVSSFAIFAAMLLIVKLFDLRSPRDESQVLILLVALIVASVLTSNSMLTGLLLMVTGVVLLKAVLRFQMYSVAYRAGVHAATDVFEKRGRIDLRSFQIAIIFFGGVIGTLVFMIMPRNLGNSAFGDWGGQSGSVTGFTDEVELGRPGLISQSSTPVLDLQVFDRNAKNIGQPESPAIYLRGAVLGSYQSGRWTYDDGRQGSILGIHNLPAETTIRPASNPSRQPWSREYRISLRSSSLSESPIFVPWLPTEFRSSLAMRFGYDKSNGQMVHEGTASLSYRVRTINPELVQAVYPAKYTRPIVKASGITERIEGLASEILSNAGIEPDPQLRPFSDDLPAIRLLESHLQSKYAYTLHSEPVPAGRDATEWFLFDRREGHCEYYASALALLGRSIGINTRVITGYVASDFNEVTGQYIIRESNAHAWVEAEVGPDKWLVFDGTPRADFQQIHEPKPGLFYSITRLYETIEYAWVKGVIGYDSQSRRRIFGDIAPDFGLMKFGYKLRERVGRSRGKLVGLAIGISAIVFGTSFVLGLLMLRFRTVLRRLLDPLAAIAHRLLAVFGVRSGTPEQRAGAQLERAITRRLLAVGVERDFSTPLQTVVEASGDRIPIGLHTRLIDGVAVLYKLRFAPAQGAPGMGEVLDMARRISRSEKQ